MITEEQWLACSDVLEMLTFLQNKQIAIFKKTMTQAAEWWSHRKARLLACALVRQVWGLLAHADSRAAVEVAELYADGLCTLTDIEQARKAARVAEHMVLNNEDSIPFRYTAWAAADACCIVTTNVFVVKEVVKHVLTAVKEDPVIRNMQANLLRDSVGPFWPVHLDAPRTKKQVGLWLSVFDIASVIYSERRFLELPILADALADAGCDNAVILEHLRGSGPHALGCWALDLVLNKE